MFHMRIVSESRARLSFLELTILARREEGARDCDAQISPVSPAHPMLGGGQNKVVSSSYAPFDSAGASS